MASVPVVSSCLAGRFLKPLHLWSLPRLTRHFSIKKAPRRFALSPRRLISVETTGPVGNRADHRHAQQQLSFSKKNPVHASCSADAEQCVLYRPASAYSSMCYIGRTCLSPYSSMCYIGLHRRTIPVTHRKRLRKSLRHVWNSVF